MTTPTWAAQDGFGLRFGPHYGNRPPGGELERTAAQIRAGLGADGAPAV